MVFSGCVDEQPVGSDISDSVFLAKDIPSVLPEWQDGEYHDYPTTVRLLETFESIYPELVDVFSIGKSVLGKDIWCISITNKQKVTNKYACVIDGCIHGDEWESGEACLYLAEYLLINAQDNHTIQSILNTSKIYVIPMLNPDGREQDWRFNDNGVDLNRNFDIFFGRLRGHCLRIGKPLGMFKIPYLRFFSHDPYKYYWNCGRRAFSEPETQALRSFLSDLSEQDLAFYMNCHTALHTVATPWLSYKAPFAMQEYEKQVFDTVVDWVIDNTEYESFRGKGFDTGGNAMDWCFKRFRVPSFTFEMLSHEYDPWIGEGKHVHLVHWMQTTLPVFMFLLVNIEHLHDWESPIIQPFLPEGVPPVPFV